MMAIFASSAGWIWKPPGRLIQARAPLTSDPKPGIKTIAKPITPAPHKNGVQARSKRQSTTVAPYASRPPIKILITWRFKQYWPSNPLRMYQSRVAAHTRSVPMIRSSATTAVNTGSQPCNRDWRLRRYNRWRA
ncbi:hypothetical protein FGO68_gene13919 [Halteria grandinella]|uniref:Uncharacterized protein n=1 Tax=Halteria grandinella TaxID=5974 RepID=A0A8J8N981_HALGN|nr:hypothetical protein FGO68_gene13919 [Halteria grandinella]